jgi:hypothetical protein
MDMSVAYPSSSYRIDDVTHSPRVVTATTWVLAVPLLATGSAGRSALPRPPSRAGRLNRDDEADSRRDGSHRLPRGQHLTHTTGRHVVSWTVTVTLPN